MEVLPKSYNPEYIRAKCLAYYNEYVKSNPDAYAKKKKQVASYMTERYKNDPEYREKQKQRQKELYQKKKLQKISSN